LQPAVCTTTQELVIENELYRVSREPPPTEGPVNPHQSGISIAVIKFLEKVISKMRKHAIQRKRIIINIIHMSKSLSPDFTGIRELGPSIWEINKTKFNFFFDLYRYACDLVPIIDKTEYWRKISGFKGEPKEGHIIVTFFEDSSKFIYEHIQNAPKQSEIESLLLEIQNSTKAREILQAKFDDYRETNETKPKQNKKRTKNARTQNKRRRTNETQRDVRVPVPQYYQLPILPQENTQRLPYQQAYPLPNYPQSYQEPFQQFVHPYQHILNQRDDECKTTIYHF